MIGCMNFVSFFSFLWQRKISPQALGVATSNNGSTLAIVTTTPLIPARMVTNYKKTNEVLVTDTEAPLGSFTLFRKLPVNLRVKIWKLANSQPRIIMVEHYHDGWSKTARPPKHPSTLAASFESRDEAKKAYKMIFDLRLGHPVAFNYAIDALFLSNYDVTWYFRGPAYQRYDVDHRASVRYLALNNFRGRIYIDEDTGEVEFSFLDIKDILDITKWFPATQELFFIPKYELKGIMKVVEHGLTKVVHGRLRKLRRECCILHDPECDCAFWRFPKIQVLTLPKMMEYLDADVLNVNDEHFGEPLDDDDVRSMS